MGWLLFTSQQHSTLMERCQHMSLIVHCIYSSLGFACIAGFRNRTSLYTIRFALSRLAQIGTYICLNFLGLTWILLKRDSSGFPTEALWHRSEWPLSPMPIHMCECSFKKSKGWIHLTQQLTFVRIRRVVVSCTDWGQHKREARREW